MMGRDLGSVWECNDDRRNLDRYKILTKTFQIQFVGSCKSLGLDCLVVREPEPALLPEETAGRVRFLLLLIADQKFACRVCKEA